jgi:high affinity Mn2+ porin
LSFFDAGTPCYRCRPRRRLKARCLSHVLTKATIVGLLLCLASPSGHAQSSPDPDNPPPPQNWAIHGQTTTTFQSTPAFRSPYQGPQSLSPATNGRETFDATLFAGLRPWQDAEIWVNPEIDQGFGLDNTLGVAGFPSAEAYKVGQATPYFRLHRLFLRQTINLGGEIQTIDPTANLLGGSQTANRVVITIGKFSAADIFDTNQYAHDPRGDFLNWSIVDAGAWDYAADSWGYTVGGAVEWYQDWWTIRTGLFDYSIVPNGTTLDPVFISQAQFNLELEERHQLWSQPGKLKALFSLGRARFGTYSDALALAAQTGTLPNLAAVANYRSKYGVGLNLEQQINPDFGLFARASWTQGDVQAYDFTDISASGSLGMALKGSAWSRHDDTIGAAIVINSISGAAQAYFNAGGLGVLVGDGRLPKPGLEQIFETYYSLAPFDFATLTADYQFINNPAYNTQRGPVNVIALRLHGQF